MFPRRLKCVVKLLTTETVAICSPTSTVRESSAYSILREHIITWGNVSLCTSLLFPSLERAMACYRILQPSGDCTLGGLGPEQQRKESSQWTPAQESWKLGFTQIQITLRREAYVDSDTIVENRSAHWGICSLGKATDVPAWWNLVIFKRLCHRNMGNKMSAWGFLPSVNEDFFTVR